MRSRRSGVSSIIDGDVVWHEIVPRDLFIEQANQDIQQALHELKQ